MWVGELKIPEKVQGQTLELGDLKLGICIHDSASLMGRVYPGHTSSSGHVQ